MQAHVRILTASVLLALAADDFAQPAPTPSSGGNAEVSNTNLSRVIRRFQRATNAALETNQVATPNAGQTTPAAAQTAPPAFPTLPPPPVIRTRRTNVVSAPGGTNQNVAVPAGATTPTNAAVVAQPTIVDQSTVVQQTPTPGATVPAVPPTTQIPVPGTDRTATPIPDTSAPGSTALTTAQDAEAAVIGAPSSSPVNPSMNESDIIPAGTIALNVMPVEQFFDLYSIYSGRTVLRALTLPAPAGLTLKATTDLTRREVVEAMDGVLALNGITMIPMGDKFVKAVPSTLADKEGAEISTVPADQLPIAEQFITRIVKLKTAKPSEVAPTLQTMSKTAAAVTAIDSNQTLILRDYSSNIRRMLDVIEKIDVMPESDFTLEVIPIRYGKVGDIHATMNALISGAGGGGTGASTTAGAATTAGGTGALGRGGFGGGGGRFGGMGGSRFGGGGYGGGGYGGYGGGSYNRSGYGGYGGSTGSYYPYQAENPQEVTPQQVAPGASPGAAQSSFQGRLNQIINRAANPDQVKILENAQIVPDERSNKLLIFANKRDMAMITNIVSKVDVLLAQVLIEAVIMEVKLGDSMNIGINAVQHPKQFGGDFRGAGVMNNSTLLQNLTNFPSGGGAQGFTYLANIGDDFDVAIRAVAEDSQIKIISRPRIHTSHAMPGFFFIGETVPYVTGSYDYGLGGGVSRSIVNERQVGLTLEVTPIITPEGMVIMDIVQDFQQRGEDVIIDDNPIPLVNSRSAGSFLTVRDGDLIMLGGFISETRSTGKSGIPFLKDIPGLGVLFRSSNKSNDRTELIMLIKATVLNSPEEAAFLAETERVMLPGVRTAEQEFQESEAKRQKKVEKRGRR